MYFAAFMISAAVAVGQVNTDNPLEEAAWLIGTWEGTYQLPSGAPELGQGGEKVNEVITWRWALDKKFIIFRGRSQIEGQPTFTTHEINGIDPQTGEVASWLFNSTGAQGDGRWSREGDDYILSWKVTQPDHTVFEGRSYMRQVKADTYTWGMRNVKRNGEQIPDWGPVTFTKRPDRPRRSP